MTLPALIARGGDGSFGSFAEENEMVPGANVPSWIDADRWDILAKVPAGTPPKEEQMPLRLTGPFDLDLQWIPDPGATGAAQPTDNGAQVDGTSLSAAMQQQLGLRLEAQRASVPVLVIDSAERPTEN